MKKENFIAGESENIEYKVDIPSNSSTYMKTVVAFANGNGGKLIFGVENETWQVIGLKKDEIFLKVDALTNAIYDSCEPKITPSVGIQEVEGKFIIVVEIASGMQRPYYLKSKGILEGTYIRVSGTTRPAADYRLKELILEGQNRFYDSEPCYEFTVCKADIENFCQNLKNIALKNALTDADKAAVKDITENVLLSWGVLIEKDGIIMPTNAYALMSGKARFQPVIQAGVFKGYDRAYFVDRREFSGPIQNQLEDAYQYVLEKINRGMKIYGIYRQDVYELPLGSIREIIANAVAHRSYLEPNDIQIALFDDRLEITSPGMLLNGVSIEKMKAGYSKVRNRAIAYAFSYMKIIEKWGSGIPRVMKECRDYGLPDPQFIDFDGDFRVNMFRINGDKNFSYDTIGTNHDYIDTINDTNNTNYDTIQPLSNSTLKVHILQLMRNNPKITQKEIQEKSEVSLRSVKRAIADLQKQGYVIRKGNNRSGEWIVKF